MWDFAATTRVLICAASELFITLDAITVSVVSELINVVIVLAFKSLNCIVKPHYSGSELINNIHVCMYALTYTYTKFNLIACFNCSETYRIQICF